jgi:hypothetical protein
VTLSELLKLVVCICVTSYARRAEGLIGMIKGTYYDVFGKFKESCRMMVPAGLYAIQNNLLFLALSNLDPAVYLYVVQRHVTPFRLLFVVVTVVVLLLLMYVVQRHVTRPFRVAPERVHKFHSRSLCTATLTGCCTS